MAGETFFTKLFPPHPLQKIFNKKDLTTAALFAGNRSKTRPIRGLFCFWTHSASVAHNPLSANNAAVCLCIADCGRPMVAPTGWRFPANNAAVACPLCVRILRGRGGAFGKSTPSKRRTSYVAVRLFFLCVKDFEGVIGGTFFKSPPYSTPPLFPRLEKSGFFHIFLFWRVSRPFFKKNCGKLCGNCVKLAFFVNFIFSQAVENFCFLRRETLFQVSRLSVLATQAAHTLSLAFWRDL